LAAIEFQEHIMTEKIKQAELAIANGQLALLAAIREAFPIGAEVKSHGPRDPIPCIVNDHIDCYTLQLTVKKSGAIINRKYSSVEV
jgi:hypothetical protein